MFYWALSLSEYNITCTSINILHKANVNIIASKIVHLLSREFQIKFKEWQEVTKDKVQIPP